MKYEQGTFTLPVASKKVSQDAWDKIFGQPDENRKVTHRDTKHEPRSPKGMPADITKIPPARPCSRGKE